MSLQSFYIANALSLANASFVSHEDAKTWVQGKRDEAAVNVARGPPAKKGEKKNVLQMLPLDILQYLHPDPLHCFGVGFRKLTYESEMKELTVELAKAKDYLELSKTTELKGQDYTVFSAIDNIQAQIDKLKADKTRYSQGAQEYILKINWSSWRRDASTKTNGVVKVDPFFSQNPFYYLTRHDVIYENTPPGFWPEPPEYFPDAPVIPVYPDPIFVVAKEDFHKIGEDLHLHYNPNKAMYKNGLVRKDHCVRISGYNARVATSLQDGLCEIEFDIPETNIAKAMKLINALNKTDRIEYSNHKQSDGGNFIATFKTDAKFLEARNLHNFWLHNDALPKDRVKVEENVSEFFADGSRVLVQGYNGITAEKCFNTMTQEYHVILCLGDLDTMGIMAANKIRKKFEKDRIPGVRFTDEEKRMSMPKRNENSNSWECSVYVQKNLVKDAN